MSTSSGDFDLSAYIARWKGEVDVVLDTLLPPADEAPVSLHEAMRYSVFTGGKRIRPVLCVAGCEAVGGDPGTCLRAGAAIEMVHAYSLVHDDLPAMDDDDLRRGRPTCHKRYGEAVAILAGDGLLTEAFAALGGDSSLAPELRVELTAGLAAAAGPRGMVAGQVVDIETEGREFAAADVEFIHLNKTARMIENAAASGAIIGGGSEATIESVRSYGKEVGLAFQVIDDVLNVTGGEDLGKGVGTDAARGKATYPALFGVDGSRQKARELHDRALEAISAFDHRATPLRSLAGLILNRSK